MINKVILVGNVGADPEIRTLEGGTKVARVRLATSERIYNKQTQEAKEHTEWHTITLWRNLADVADRFIRKGSQIYVEGKIRSREWTDANNVKRFGIEIVADELKLLGRKPEGVGMPADGTSYTPPAAQNTATSQPIQAEQPAMTSADEIDDLPF